MILFPISRESFLPFLIVSLIFGFVLGAFYDVARIRHIAFRRSVKKAVKIADAIIIFFEDVIFFVFAAIGIILISYKLHYGIIRWYAVGALALGFFIYRKTLGVLIMAISEKIINIICRILLFIKRRVILPAFRGIISISEKAGSKIKGNYKNRMQKIRAKKQNARKEYTDV